MKIDTEKTIVIKLNLNEAFCLKGFINRNQIDASKETDNIEKVASKIADEIEAQGI